MSSEVLEKLIPEALSWNIETHFKNIRRAWRCRASNKCYQGTRKSPHPSYMAKLDRSSPNDAGQMSHGQDLGYA